MTRRRSGPRWLGNARIVTPDRVIEGGSVRVEGTRIAAVGRNTGESGEPTVDLGGALVLPGLVDLHGDDLERYRFPREGATVDVPTALTACDRANVAAGITTKFHAVAFEDAPADHRSIEGARAVTAAVEAVEGLLADNRVNARCEVGEDRAVGAVLDAIDRRAVELVSLMNHLPECGQFDDRAQFERRYTDGGQPESGVVDDRRRVARPARDERARAVIRAAHEADLAVASHDDEHESQVEALSALGVDISEYPVTMAAARRASEREVVTAMGAPNLVRGGSLWDNLSAIDAIRAGVVDVLCTDFHPQSLLASLFVDTGEPLTDRVARVTSAPATAVGLEERGRIEAGARADLVVVDPGPPPRVRRVFVAGTEVYRAAPPANR